jgi:AsmA protein
VRIARWVAAIVGGLVVLVLLTVLTVTVFVDPNRFRGQIERAVTRATGQPFEIEGDLEISWFPWLALRMGASQFGEAESVAGEAPQPIVQWESARVGARLVPLLKGQLIVDIVRLDGAKFRLVRHADGTSNWDPVVTAFKNRKSEPPVAGEEEPGAQVSGFQLRKGSLTYLDERPDSKRNVAVTNWSLDVGEWRAGATFPVETELSLAVENKFRAEGLRLSSRLHVSEDANDIDLFGLEFSSRVGGGVLPSKGLPVEFQVSRMAVRLTPLDISISELSSRIAGVGLITSVQGGETVPDKKPYVRGPIDLQVPSVRELLKTLEIDAPLPLDKGTFGRMKLTSMLAWENGAITANGIELDLDDTHFSGEMARTAGEQPLWTFALRGNKIGLGRYVAIEDKSSKPFELPVKALRELRAQGELTFEEATLGEAQMKGVKLRLEMQDGQVRTASK